MELFETLEDDADVSPGPYVVLLVASGGRGASVCFSTGVCARTVVSDKGEKGLGVFSARPVPNDVEGLLF